LTLVNRLIKKTSMRKPPTQTAGSEQTRQSLIEAALRLFGERGYEAASTRDIAAAANANIGSIAYHFGGKAGLRIACAEHIVKLVTGLAGPLLPDGAGAPAAAPREKFLQVLDTLGNFVLASPQAGLLVQFILRELAQPSPALDIIYGGLFEPIHRRLCRVWQDITGEDAESEETRLTVFTLIGQVVYFRIGRQAVMRRMGWDEVGPDEAGAIISIVARNIGAVIDARHRAGRNEE
jgi:AcrR family transcriptional regulator